MTRLAVISDTHLPRGQRRLPDRCVELLRGADAILHAGDVAPRRADSKTSSGCRLPGFAVTTQALVNPFGNGATPI